MVELPPWDLFLCTSHPTLEQGEWPLAAKAWAPLGEWLLRNRTLLLTFTTSSSGAGEVLSSSNNAVGSAADWIYWMMGQRPEAKHEVSSLSPVPALHSDLAPFWSPLKTHQVLPGLSKSSNSSSKTQMSRRPNSSKTKLHLKREAAPWKEARWLLGGWISDLMVTGKHFGIENISGFPQIRFYRK